METREGGCTVESCSGDVVWSRVAVDAEMQRSRLSPVPAVMMEMGCYLDIRNNPRLLQKSARENHCCSYGRDRDHPKLFDNGSVGNSNGNSLTSVAKLRPCLHTK